MEPMKIPFAMLERVDAGYDWLNENLPDWRDFVRIDQLDMAWEENCILGQYNWMRYADSNFDKAVHAYFGGDVDRATELGFLEDDLDYTALTTAWKQKLMSHGEEAQG